LLAKSKANATPYDCVWVEPSNRPNPDTRIRLKNTITMMGLNAFSAGDSDPKMSDRRVLNRTAAWDRASELARHFAARRPPALGSDLLMEQIKQAAIATGFWSVWMTVFQQTVPPDPQRAAWLEAMFGS